jgi:hypothetical protein
VRTIKNANVVQTEKSAAKHMPAFRIFAIHPPSEIDQQLLKGSLQKEKISLTLGIGNFIYPPYRTSMHGRIHIGKIPLISRELTIRMHVPFT